MKPSAPTHRRPGFTLLETVIAIGVLAVLLTGFVIVFAPAAAGIKRSISVQEADRLVSGLEQELVTLRDGQTVSSTSKTGFSKAFDWIKEANAQDKAVFVYQYRGSLSGRRGDGTPNPVADVRAGKPGEDYTVMPMVRRRNDPELVNDLPAVEGGLYLVKCTQLVFDGGELKPGTPGEIKNPKPNTNPPDPNYKAGPFGNADEYPEAVIAFTGEFHSLPAKSKDYVNGAGFTKYFNSSAKPVFTRNLAVRR